MKDELLHKLAIAMYETGDKKTRDFAAQVEAFRIGKYNKPYQIEKKLYSLLENIIDFRSSALLEISLHTIQKISNRLINDGGWYVGASGITDFTSEERAIKNFPDEYEEGKRLYHLDRDETGYHVGTDIPAPNTIYDFARKTEIKFAETRKKELDLLHQMYTIKEKIMTGECVVKLGYEELFELICEYFGYQQQPKKVPTK